MSCARMFIANPALRQACFGNDGQTLTQSDLSLFQTTYGATKKPATMVGTVADGFGAEASLDTQYIMGIAQDAEGIYWYENYGNVGVSTSDRYLDFLINVYNYKDFVSVLSISYGTSEEDVNGEMLYLFNTEAIKSSAIGITIVASSGDDGVAGPTCGCIDDSSYNSALYADPKIWGGAGTWTGEGYFPQYPCSSPYVLAVGGTSGPNNGLTERVAQVYKLIVYVCMN